MNLTLTRIVFEFKCEEAWNSPEMNLTLTRIVFEFNINLILYHYYFI